MKNFVIIALLFLITSSTNLHAQSRKYWQPTVTKKHSLSPAMTYYRGFNILEKAGQNTYTFLPSRKHRGSILDYMQFGVNYRYAFSPKWSIATGLMYSNPGFKSDESSRLMIHRIQDFAVIESPAPAQIIRRNFIEIPTLVHHSFFNNNICSSYIEMGIIHQFYQTSYTDSGSSTTYRMVESQRKYHASAQLNFGSSFFIQENIQLFTQLNTTYQVITLQQSGYDDRHVGLGVSVGARYLW